MNCKFCDLSRNLEDRKMPNSTNEDFQDEKCWIRKDGHYYNLAVQYDAGYAFTEIESINYCPMCGRKLQK